MINVKRSGSPTNPSGSLLPRSIANVQVLRSAAALLVVLAHIRGEIDQYGIENDWPLLTFGVVGVDVFFVISGFLMVYATRETFGEVGAAPVFLLRRIVRIVPLYWLVTAAYVIFVVRTGQDPGYHRSFLVASFLFFPSPQPDDGDYFPAYSLGWTLEYEMFFYLLFACVVPLRRPVAIGVLSLGLLGLVIAGRLRALPQPFNFWSNMQVVEFVFGMVLAEVYLRGLRLPAWGCVMLAFSGFAVVVATAPILNDVLPYRGLVWGIPATAVFAGAVLQRPAASGTIKRFFERLGDASYSLYLTHYLLFVVAAEVLTIAGHPRIPAPVYGAGLLVLAITAAFATYHGFERPVTRGLQRQLRGVRRRSATIGDT